MNTEEGNSNLLAMQPRMFVTVFNFKHHAATNMYMYVCRISFIPYIGHTYDSVRHLLLSCSFSNVCMSTAEGLC